MNGWAKFNLTLDYAMFNSDTSYFHYKRDQFN